MPDVFRTILEKSALYDFDSVCKLWIGPKLIVFLFNPADVELILSSHVYIDKSAEYDFFKPWLGDGLLISTGKLFLNCNHKPRNCTNGVIQHLYNFPNAGGSHFSISLFIHFFFSFFFVSFVPVCHR